MAAKARTGSVLPDLESPEILEDEEPLAALGALTTIWPGLAMPRSRAAEVGRVAYRRIVHPEVAADGADHHETGVDPHPHAELDTVGRLHVRGEWLSPPGSRAPH